jgi:hypothetical protein
LLSAAGRIVLLNTVLDALPIFAMGAVELPPALLRIIDGLRRSFLWNTVGAPSSAKCLVAWTAVCRPKSEGGLGVKSLAIKNSCLQLKLLHRLFSNPDAPWPRWVWSCAVGRGGVSGRHVDRLMDMMPLYCGLSRCTVQDGKHTAFWLDTWVGGAPLAVQFASLFSHALDKTTSVHAVLSRGVRASLVPRLNATGGGQLPSLLALVGGVALTTEDDGRTLTRCAKPTGALDAAALYKLCAFGGVDVPYHDFFWGDFAPPRVQFFAWLLSRSMIPSRSELVKKHVLEAEESLCPICDRPDETASHIIFACPFAIRFWAAAASLRVRMSGACMSSPRRPLCPPPLPQPSSSFVAGICGSTGTPWSSEASAQVFRAF